MKNIAICVLLLLVVSTANAMTGLEFMQTSNATQRHNIVQPFIIDFVSKGYKNVPDWAPLARVIDELTRQKGWGNEPIENIALEAAIKLGMKE